MVVRMSSSYPEPWLRLFYLVASWGSWIILGGDVLSAGTARQVIALHRSLFCPQKIFDEESTSCHRRNHACRVRRRVGSASLIKGLLWIATIAVASRRIMVLANANEEEVPDIFASTNSHSPSTAPRTIDPFLVVSTVDGSIGVLGAMDGIMVSGFPSGDSLVGPSEVLNGGRRIVPGLDGRLHVSSKGGVLQALEITIQDVLQTPLKTCSATTTTTASGSSATTPMDGTSQRQANNNSGCGIVTATKSTSLFALDAHTGRLVWKQSPNGTTILANNHEDDVEDDASTSTVLLQREDVIVQQLSTESGKSVWNVTLGTVQALEFGDGNAADDGGLPSGQSQDYLPSGEAQPLSSSKSGTSQSGQALTRDIVKFVELPSIAFSPDGSSLIAISSTTGQVLWKRDFPTVVASVFGLQGKSWKPLTVLEYAASNSEEHATEESSGSVSLRPQSNQLTSAKSFESIFPDPPYLGGFAARRPPLMQRIYSYWQERSSSLYNLLTEDWFADHGHEVFFSQTSDAMHHPYLPPKQQRMTPPRHHDLFALPSHQHQQKTTTTIRLSLPSGSIQSDAISVSATSTTSHPRLPSYYFNSREGVYMAWPVLLAICLVVVGCATLIFIVFYLKKKKKWANARIDDTANSSANPRKALKRSHSLPEVTIRGNGDDINVGSSNAELKRRFRSESLHVHYTADGDLALPKDQSNESGQKAGSGPAKKSNTLTTTTSTEQISSKLQEEQEKQQQQQQQQEQGVGFLVDGIPLIRYNRYDSEFTEVVALGKGGFGTVFRCQNVLDGREYAIKKVALKYDTRLPQSEFRQRLQRTLREVKSLALLDHPNIVRYYTAWLELQQGHDGSKREIGDGLGDSDYYIFSPTNTANHPTKSHVIEPSSLGMPSQQLSRRPSLEGGLRKNYYKSENPLAGPWNGLHEHSFSHLAPGIPEALDDYGFTFDRGDEEEIEFVQDSTATSSPKTLKHSLTKDKVRSIDFHAGKPMVHHYSPNSSGNGFESSIEESTTNTGGWSHESRNHSDKQTTSKNSSAEETETQEQSSKKSSSTTLVRHILFIQMQFCSQKTLADFLSNPEARRSDEASGGLDIPYALTLFLQIAQGVQHVHGQGLIHRDLKPNNCFIDDSGVVKVGDFGLSRESTGDSPDKLDFHSEVQDDVVGGTKDLGKEITAGVGTRSYASPEQMQGSDYDSSTDIYSLGIMLFELCYPMYTGMERTIVLSKLRSHEFPKDWSRDVQPLFPTLHSLLQSMLSSSPSDRPTAETVVGNIRTILEGYTISSIDKHHHESAVLLRVEAKPREDVLRHTIEIIKEAATPDCVEILQYGLRGGTNKAIMEFAISSPTCGDWVKLGSLLVKKIEKRDEILLIRKVSATRYT